MYFFVFLVHNKNVMNQILNTKLKKTVNQILSIETKKEVNQILNTKFEPSQTLPSSYSTYTSEILPYKKNWFRFQFIFSIFIIIILVFSGSLYFSYLEKQENRSNGLIANYNIHRLYSSSNENESLETFNGLFGIIEIPKLDLYYPVFSHLTEDLLKIAPCKFYGNTPDKNGNICIAGHNYDNSLFFSKLPHLSFNDEIHIFDNNGTQYVYFVYDMYEVIDTDLSPVFDYEQNEKTLTLVTCNNFNSNRIILKANQKKPS